jgi:hypothetical protein
MPGKTVFPEAAIDVPGEYARKANATIRVIRVRRILLIGTKSILISRFLPQSSPRQEINFLPRQEIRVFPDRSQHTLSYGQSYSQSLPKC